MAAPITIEFVRDPQYFTTDSLQLTINDVVQPDPITIWDPSRNLIGYGQDLPNAVGYGAPPSQAYGGGPYGIGADLISKNTINAFVAGDYSVQALAIDALGNEGSLSSAITIHHRPIPPVPQNLAVADNVLTWTWSDP